MKALIALIFIYSLLPAAPAYTGERTITLSDGSTLKASLRGDEYLNWFETERGDIILYSKTRKRFEHPHIVDHEFKPSGVAYAPGSGSSHSAALRPSIEKSELMKLWRDKRARATQQRRLNR